MAVFSKSVLCVVGVALATIVCADRLPLGVCQKRAAAGDAEALYQLGQRYETGEGVRKDGLKAVSRYRQAAEKDHPQACARLAELYETGTIVGKDPVRAARYRARARGESGEQAAAEAKKEQERAKVDMIEVALDYIIGRNGKTQDAKKGVRLLYETAKDDPTAQRVFVERWERGNLDAGLEMIGEEEWSLIFPWFKTQYEKGRHKGGLVLGIAARKEGRYEEAVQYWTASGTAGVPRAWFLLGEFYYYDEENGGGPKSMRSDLKAKRAVENCLTQDSSWLEARVFLGNICLYGEGKAADYPRAKGIFASLMRADPDNADYLYKYARAGWQNIFRRFNARWPVRRTEYLWQQHQKNCLTGQERQEMKRYLEDLEKGAKEEAKWMKDIRRAAEKGCKEAEEVYRKWLQGKQEARSE